MTTCLLVYPNALRYPFVPIGFTTIAALAQALFDETGLFDATFEEDGELLGSFRSSLDSFDPDVVAIHCGSADWLLLRAMLDAVADKLATRAVLVGGPHATVAAREILGSATVDAVVVGEAEIALPEIIERIKAGRGLHDAPNCITRNLCSDRALQLAPLAALDDLPYPSWGIFDVRHMTFEIEPGVSQRECGLETSRGCPCSCAYCVTDHVRRLYRDQRGVFCRHKSVERVVAEAQYLRDELGVEFIHIIDDNLVQSTARLEALADAFSRDVGLPLFMQASADLVSPEVARLMAKMGARRVGIGVEVGDDEYRRTVLQKRVTNAQITAAFEHLRHEDVQPCAYYMIGLPHQGLHDVGRTARLNARLQPERAYVSNYFPFPGTALYEMISAEGLLPPVDQTPDYFSSGITLGLSGMTRKQTAEARDLFPNAYRRDPGTVGAGGGGRDMSAVRAGASL